MKKQEDEAIPTYTPVPARQRGLGPDSAGQSGDTQGLPDEPEADSESVEELVQEGQYSEADAIDGVEEAGEPREVRTRQLKEDDVPTEYDNPD